MNGDLRSAHRACAAAGACALVFPDNLESVRSVAGGAVKVFRRFRHRLLKGYLLTGRTTTISGGGGMGSPFDRRSVARASRAQTTSAKTSGRATLSVY
jgi:hypothetical protein